MKPLSINAIWRVHCVAMEKVLIVLKQERCVKIKSRKVTRKKKINLFAIANLGTLFSPL